MFRSGAFAAGLTAFVSLLPALGISNVLSPAVLWATIYEGGGYSQVTNDAAGNAYVTGALSPGSVGLVKFGVGGGVVWTAAASGWCHDVARDAGGNCYVTGWLNGANIAMFLTKYTPAGGPLWTKSFDLGRDEFGHAVCVDLSGSVYVAGVSEDLFGGVAFCAFVCKYSSGGTLIWSRTAGENVNYFHESGVASDSGGNVYLSYPISDGSNDYTGLCKYSPAGELVWSRTSLPRYGDSLVTDGTYLYMNSVKLTLNGDVVFEKSCFSGTDLFLGPDGYLYSVVGFGVGFGDVSVRKYSKHGTRIWSVTHDGGVVESVCGVSVPEGDVVYVCGGTSGSPSKAFLYKLKIRYGPTGVGLTALGGYENITLNWSAATPGTYAMSGYHVYRSTCSGFVPSPGTLVDSVVGAGNVGFTDSAVTRGTTYCYVVRPVDVEINEGDLSNETCASLSLASPTNLTALGVGCSSILLSWQKSVSNIVTGYRIYRSSFPGPVGESLLISLGASASVYLDTDVSQGGQYWYHVIAVSGIYESVPTDEVAVRIDACDPPLTLPYQGPVRVFPNPFNPKIAVRGTVKFEGLPAGSRVRVYASSGLRVWEGNGSASGLVEWNGKTGDGKPVAPGVYQWVSEVGGVKDRGMLIVE